jgi:RHS repeat-associated protein
MLLMLCRAVRAGTVTYVYTDPQGTPLAEADASGIITARFEYTPYGSSVNAVGAAPDGPGYTGHVNDLDTGLVYMQARYYDPSSGRFLGIDPIGIDIGSFYSFNRYGYAKNNPVNNSDPSGLCPIATDQDGCDVSGPAAAAFDENPPPLVPPTPPPPPPPPPSPKDATPLPPVTVTANSQNISVIPPIFKIPEGRPLFRKSLARTIARQIDDFASKQIVKRASFKTLTISPEGFLKPTPFAFGIYIMSHAEGLGGCDGGGHCADEAPASSVIHSPGEDGKGNK